MKKFILGLVVLPFLAGVSLAAQPVALSDKQMDAVTAGFDFAEVDVTNTSFTVVIVDGFVPVAPPATVCAGCYLNIGGTQYPSGIRSFQLYSAFGP